LWDIFQQILEGWLTSSGDTEEEGKARNGVGQKTSKRLSDFYQRGWGRKPKKCPSRSNGLEKRKRKIGRGDRATLREKLKRKLGEVPSKGREANVRERKEN